MIMSGSSLNRLRGIAKVTALCLLSVVLPVSARAQLVDTKDATNISIQSVPPPLEPATFALPVADEDQTKDCFIDHSDGFVARRHPEKVRLEIASAELHFVDDNTLITLTVRLKNEGHWAVLLPWQTDAVEPEKTGGPNDEVRYEAAGLRLKLGTQENRAHGAFIRGRVEFQAAPHRYEEHIRLLPGQWVEVRLSALAKCLYDAADAPLCSEFKADEHARLTAHWTEWLFTEQRNQGCNDVTSSAKSRMIDSDPVEIDFAPPNELRTSSEGDSVSSQEPKPQP